jgi:glycosyltransferase involved in cell wall biosynthesis
MDLAFLKYPETFRSRDLWQLKSWTEYSVKKAKHVFVISQATKKDVMKAYGVTAGKITIAYPGVKRLPATGKSPAAGKYLLYIGTLQPRKNIKALIDAFKTLSPAGMKLVIAGKTGWKYQPKPEANIKYLGFVPEEKMAALIKRADGLVLPSLYEGFGIPVVQAMSLGTPVLISRNSSLPEIVGNTGLYIEAPFDMPVIKAGLEKLLSLTLVEKQKLTVAAKLRASKFTWQKAGQVILETMVKYRDEFTV